jgi:hypothetical protein
LETHLSLYYSLELFFVQAGLSFLRKKNFLYIFPVLNNVQWSQTTWIFDEHKKWKWQLNNYNLCSFSIQSFNYSMISKIFFHFPIGPPVVAILRFLINTTNIWHIPVKFAVNGLIVVVDINNYFSYSGGSHLGFFIDTYKSANPC